MWYFGTKAQVLEILVTFKSLFALLYTWCLQKRKLPTKVSLSEERVVPLILLPMKGLGACRGSARGASASRNAVILKVDGNVS